jgi:hypothetical protein
MAPACKPGSVECCHSDGHSSRSAVARALEQPTRSVLIGTGRPSLPIWPCSRWGLPCHGRCRSRGGLLPHRFTLACAPANRSHRRSALCCTVRRRLAAPPRRYLAARPPEPGLSSSVCTLATVRPATSRRKVTRRPPHALTWLRQSSDGWMTNTASLCIVAETRRRASPPLPGRAEPCRMMPEAQRICRPSRRC